MSRKKDVSGVWWKSFSDPEEAFIGLYFLELSDNSFKSDREKLRAWEHNLQKFEAVLDEPEYNARWKMRENFLHEIDILKMKLAGTYEEYLRREREESSKLAHDVLVDLEKRGFIYKKDGIYSLTDNHGDKQQEKRITENKPA